MRNDDVAFALDRMRDICEVRFRKSTAYAAAIAVRSHIYHIPYSVSES